MDKITLVLTVLVIVSNVSLNKILIIKKFIFFNWFLLISSRNPEGPFFFVNGSNKIIL